MSYVDQTWRVILCRKFQGAPCTVASSGFQIHSALCIVYKKVANRVVFAGKIGTSLPLFVIFDLQ